MTRLGATAPIESDATALHTTLRDFGKASKQERLAAGECAAFKAGDPDGHHLVNRSSRDAVVLEVGTRDPEHDRCVYPDIDMVAEPKVEPYLHRTGEAYPINKPSTWLVGQAP